MRLEELGRGLLLRAIVGLFARTPPQPLPDWRARPHRVLFIRNDGIGDLIVSMEVMRAIAESSPTIVLDVLASPQNAALARTLPFVKDVIVHRRAFLPRNWTLWRDLRARRYDAVVDGRVVLRGLSTQTTSILLATGAPWRIGVGGRINDGVYTVKVRPARTEHWTDYVVALAGPFGVAADSRDWRPRLPLSSEQQAAAERMWLDGGATRPRVLVNVSVGHPERSWPAEKFAILLRHLRERLPGAVMVLASMPAEQAMADELASRVGARAVAMKLPELFAALATADLLISPETAVTHAASAFRTPTLALQRKGNSRWSPYATPGRNVFSDDERRLWTLPVERAIAGLDALIDDLGTARGWR
jgi:heptosyltransferase I